MIKEGISITKENAATALATVVEQVGTDFIQYFEESLNFLLGAL